jgi:FKBP-type peptidyl-prolyl cis-trans isomerase/DnaJ domain
MAKDRDYYSILQVNRAAGDAEIEAAYKRLQKLYDPAVSRKPRAPARWAEISHAYETLSDRQRRFEYDRQLARRPPAAPGGPEIDLPDWVTGPYTLTAAAIGLVVVALVGLVLASVLSGDDAPAAVTQPTFTVPSTIAVPLPTQSPIEPPANPPEVSGQGITTASGLQYIELQPGTGATPTTGQTVVANYTGWLADTGALFDSSLSRPEPFSFPLGQGAVIEGWDEGFATMQVGSKRRLIIPAGLAYGAEGREGIPPNSTLIFDVELLEVR